MSYSIRAQSLSKLYYIGQQKQRASYVTLRDALAGMFRRAGRSRTRVLPRPGRHGSGGSCAA